jgi:phenylpropionate dioxygenase-like ring-hydroxylating dioxygenase large terminal subunit
MEHSGVQDGALSSELFTADVHERELERVFGHCWLLLGHTSMLPKTHDYFLSQMGVDSVIVQRSGDDRIRAFLNRCRHRGAELCIYEAGNTRTFTCGYHGWCYGEGGKLVGVPRQEEAYGSLDRSSLGLIEVPRVQTFGGLIFASWDPEAESLEDYLGDAKWWLENFVLREEDGGLEIIPGTQKYMMRVNWKLIAENFAGDAYHFLTTHGWVARAHSRTENSSVTQVLTPDEKRKRGHDFSVAANYGRGAPHGFLEVGVGPMSYEHDLLEAQKLGAEAVEWVKERQRRLEERLKDYAEKPYSFHAGNIFPNFGLIGVGTALYGKGLFLHHPTSPEDCEVWLWCAVEKSAPPAVKQRQKLVLAQRQSGAGLMAPDDAEMFLRISDSLRGPFSRRQGFHYAMGLGHETEDPRPPEWQSHPKWPGQLLPQFSEAAQREFYRYWAERMNEA